MAEIISARTWGVAVALGLFAALMGVVALLIDMIQGDPFNAAVLPAIGAGLLIASLSLTQRKKAQKAEESE